MGIRARLLVASVLACVALGAWGVPAQAEAAAGTLSPIAGLESLSNPSPNRWYPSHDVTFSWTPLAGVFGYRMGLDDDPAGKAFSAGGMPPQTYSGFGPSFSADAVLDVGRLSWPATGDFNGDGVLDLAGVTNPWNVGFFTGSAGSVVVALGHGDGSFGPLTSYPLGDASAGSVAVADLDEDGTPDLAVGASAIGLFEGARGRLVILRGTGDGTFAEARRYALPGAEGFGTGAMAAHDFDGDGHVDLAWENVWGSAVGVVAGAGDGTFAAPAFYPIDSSYTRGLACGDFNDDGRPDLAVANQGRNAVSVLLGSSAGGFAPCVDYATGGDNPYSVATTDLDGDGCLDLAVVNDSVPYGVGVLTGRGDGTFAPAVMTECGYAPQQVVAGHFTDGKAFVAMISPLSFSVDVLSDYGPDGLSSDVEYSVYGSSLGCADLDGDGGSDLLADGGTVLMSTVTHELRNETPYATGDRPAAVAAADLNGDGNADVVTADRGGDTVSVLLGGGDATLGPRSSFATGAGPCALAIADLDRDGKRDVVTADGGADTASVLLGTGDGRLAAAAHYAAGASPAAVAVADLNGDGSPDAVTADRAADTASVLLGAGDGTLAGAVPYAAGASPAAVAVADLNGDGHRDVVVVGDGNDGVSVLLGNGDGTLDSAVRYAYGLAASSLAITDLDGDGLLDVVCGLKYTDLAVLSGNGDGTLQVPVFRQTYGSARSLVVTDVNGDGRRDIVATGSGQTSASVLLGTPTGLLFYGYPFYTTGAAQAMTAADFDNDGRMDLVVAQGASAADEPSANTVALLHNTLVDPLEQYTSIADGIWYFHAQAVGTDGSRGPVSSLTVKIDSTPPVTQATAVMGWVSKGVAASFAASDPSLSGSVGASTRAAASGTARAQGVVQTSGVAYSQSSLDGGTTWSNGMSVSVDALRLSGGDGLRAILYRSVDNAGNVESSRSTSVNIDTRAPTPQLRTASARSGRRASVRFRVLDPTPCAGIATLRMEIKNAAGRVVLRLGRYSVRTGTWTSRGFNCRLKRGTYRVLAYAADDAGNGQSKVGRTTLVVR